jgi:peptidyl-prolyl cis-trans isomerase B (cyclophilin B)
MSLSISLASLALGVLLACSDGSQDAKPAAKPQAAPPASGAPQAAPGAAAGDAAKAAAPAQDAVAQVDAFIASKTIDKSNPAWKSSLPKPELATFHPDQTYYWNITTNKGEMRFKLKPDIAPMHVTNAIYLTRLGFYDGTVMHRVIQGFMAQGGCPQGNGRGNPGYRINLEVTPKAKHDKPGVLSTANSGVNTDGSQYFIMFAPNAGLDGKYSVYGELDSGMDTLKQLEAVGNPGDGPPLEKLTVEKATITVEGPQAAPAGG